MIRDFIEHSFWIVLLLAFGLGLTVPGLDQIPKVTVLILLGIIIFFACSRVTLKDLQKIKPREFLGFYILRFCLIPGLIFTGASLILPEYRYALLMLALLPCGATLPGMTAIMGGNAALGLTATVITSFLIPFTLPLAFALVSDLGLEVDIWGIFQTLLAVIFIPVFLYFGFARRLRPVQAFMLNNAKLAAVLLIGCVVVIVIGAQRAEFLENPIFVVQGLFIAMGVCTGFYVLGWLVFARQENDVRISYALISGNNNIALGISLAFLYLSPQDALALVAFEPPWLLCVSGFQLFLKRRLA